MVNKQRNLIVILLLFLIVTARVFYWPREEVSEFEWLIEPRFASATDFYKGVAWVREKNDSHWKLIDKKGNVIVDNFPGEVPFFSLIDRETELIPFQSKEGSYDHGYINLSGDIVISPDYQSAGPFRNGLAYVKKDGYYGVIDRYRQIVLPFMYEFVFIRDSNMFAVKKDEKWGFINAKGETIIDFIFDQTGGQPLPGVYAVTLDKKIGLIDRIGEWILPASYDRFYSPIHFSFEQELEHIGVTKDGKTGFVDAKGNVVIDFIFRAPEADEEGVYTITFLYSFSEGLAPVILPSKDSDNKEKYGVINRSGKVLFELSGVPRGSYSEGYMLVFRIKDKKYGLVDRAGNWHSLPTNIGPRVISSRVSDGILKINRGTSLGNYGYIEIHKNEK